MTSETYLDINFERAAKSGKRPIKPKLIKLSDVGIPHRNRKKTKVKSKDRAASSVRDRIYDDPAYTDDISHLANPMRRSSCSGKSDTKAGAATSANTVTTGSGSSSLGKRSKLTKEFLQYAKQGKAGRMTGNVDRGGGGGGGVGGSYEQDASSSSDEATDMAGGKGGSSGMGRRGRSLERSMAEKTEKKREKRERSSKQKRNLSLDNNLQSHIQQQQQQLATLNQHVSKKQQQQQQKQQPELEVRNMRSKERKSSQLLAKQYSDGLPGNKWNEAGAHLPPPDQDELFSVRSSSKESTSTTAGIKIGRRLLKGEIGIKSFNYYLLKEGLKSSKKFVEKQRHSLTGGLSNSSKKMHTRSEENIYEEIFFKDAPPSDEEQTNQVNIKTSQQQPPPLPPAHQQHHAADTPLSQDSEEAIYPDCELCMQQCSKENCDYCFVAPPPLPPQAELQTGSQRGTGVRQYATTTVRQASLHQQNQQQQQQQQQQTHNKPHFGSLGRSGGIAFINQAQSTTTTTSVAAGIVQQSQQRNNNNNGGGGNNSSGSGCSNIMPTAHILEFQSYNPNNPGVYKIETTPVAITGEYNPILQFQQSQQSSSSTTTTATTTPSDQQQQQQQLHQQQQLQQQTTLQYKPVSLKQMEAYILQTGMPLSTTTMTNHYQSVGGSGAGAGGSGGGGSNMLPMSLPTRHHHHHRGGRLSSTANGQQHFIVSYNGAASMQRMHTKSSSSSDSLQQHHHHHHQQPQHQQQQHQQQQLHKFNTMARLEATNVLLGDPFYGGGQMHPLMYAASRPIGGSQILVDPYEPPQMYKSDSKASILSEYSLRSSDNSHRYARYRHGNVRGGGEVSDSSLGDSLFSTYASGRGGSSQRRYFGSSESCRFAFECRRCSLDGSGGGRREGGGGEKCSYSDTCRYECRNCDCSSSYFSSDFDEVYGGSAAGGGGGGHKSSGIPRKTAAGTLPSSTTADYEDHQQQVQQEQLDLKQNKYAQDFFKHVNDVKRSIYQSEMQRHGSLETATQQKTQTSDSLQYGRAYRSKHDHVIASPQRGSGLTIQPPLPIVCATLPLTKDSMRAATRAASTEAAIITTAIQMQTPEPAPRNSLHQQTVPTQSIANATTTPTTTSSVPQPSQRRSQTLERREYPSLDRLLAAATGAIPKTNNTLINTSGGNAVNIKSLSTTKSIATNTASSKQTSSPHQSPKSKRITDRPLGLTTNIENDTSEPIKSPMPQNEEPSMKQRERYLNVGGGGDSEATSSISTSTTSKRHHRTSSTKASSVFPTRRKDIPAPPPPSPATYADLQELKANLLVECSAPEDAAMKKTSHKTTSRQKEQEITTTTQTTAATGKTPTKIKNVETTKHSSGGSSNVRTITTAEMPCTTIETTTSLRQAEENTKANSAAAAVATAKQGVKSATSIEYAIPQPQQQATTKNAAANGNNETRISAATTAAASVTPTVGRQETSPNITLTSTSAAAAANFDTEDDDVFYDARSEDSAGTAASVASASVDKRRHKNVQNLDEGHKRPQQQMPKQQQQHQQQQIANNAQREQEKLHATLDEDKNDNNRVGGASSKHKDTREHETENGQQSRKEVSKSNTNKNNNSSNSNSNSREKRTVKIVPSEGGMQSTLALNVEERAAAPSPPIQTTSTITTSPTHEQQQHGTNSVGNNSNTPKREHHSRTRRRSSSGGGSRTRAHKPSSTTATATTTPTKPAPTLTISCDTCCQIECEQQQQQQQQQKQQQQKSNEMLPPPTLPRAKTKTSKERASKIKQEETTANNKEQVQKQNEKSTTTPTPTTCADEMLPMTAEVSTIHSATSHKRKTPETAAVVATKVKQKIGAQNATVEQEHSSNVAVADLSCNITVTCSADDVEENNTDNVVDVAVVVELNRNVASTCCNENDAVAFNVAEQTSLPTAEATSTMTTPAVNTPIATSAAAAVAETVSEAALLLDPTEAKVTNDANADADAENNDKVEAVAIAADVAGAVAVASVANATAVSCNSDGAGVVTLSHSLSSTLPTITTTNSIQTTSLEQLAKRPPLHRQDYSCLDSSEAQSDDSHLTRVSVTRESQNDELSSSTHDKIDVSALPLPALPPKKRRSRLRGSPSKYHSRSRHESTTETTLVGGEELNVDTTATSHTNVSETSSSHLSTFQQKRRESLEASTRSFHEKLEARRMHYRMGGGGGATGSGSGNGGGGGSAGNAGSASGMHMPTYLFGEHYYGLSASATRKTTVAPANKEEIFLNKSGWVQVTTKRGLGGAAGNDENRGYRRASSYAHQNGGINEMRNTIRVIQIDNTRRSDLARQALLQHQHTIGDPNGFASAAASASSALGSKYAGSKVEELIQRNEARLNSGITANNVAASAASRDPALRPGYRIIDPQLASILNERPGFLPVKNLNDADSPPPITPILSPPPAFQDSSSKSKHFDRRKPISSRHLLQQHQLLQQPIPTTKLHASSNGGAPNSNGKGMVFSRSFEYDARRPTPTDTYIETFSRSFDGNLSEQRPQPLQRERSPNFSTLTGNSPNYLSKKDSGGGSSGSLRSRDSSPKYQPQPQTTAYLNNSIKEAPPAYSVATNSNSTNNKYSPRARHERSFERSKSHNVLGRSRKSQFSRVGSSGPLGGGGGSQVPLAVGMSRFRSFDTTINQRLNSCDSGARSDLSNDELDNDDDEGGSTEFLTTNYHHNTSPFKTQRQRSLTPDRNESHSSSSSLRKQRSLTPESRSLTPEDRRKKGSQVSLMGSRQNSSSRSNTLERKQRHDEKTSNISRSSSSSSYSGREIHEPHGHATQMGSGVNVGSHHRRSLGRNTKQTDEHRIRRSRSLQLSERSPNRSQHKMIVCVGQPHPTSNQSPIYQQANVRSTNINNGGGGHSNFPPTIRTNQTILLNSSNNGRMRNSDIDKSRSFDFDYCNYNTTVAGPTTSKSSHSSSGNNSNQNIAMRLDFDKSRSFDEDYRESINSNNNLSNVVGSMRYLQTTEGGSSSNSGPGRMRRSSPVGSGSGGGGNSAERSTRSPQSSGSSCNNLNVPRQQSTSPQNYGTRLCDHELTYDMIRKSLDRSPIMDFRRGDSGDYDLPQSVISTRNRETINSGGNSELNFMNNDARIYEHPSSTTATPTTSLKQQRSLGHTQSPSESQYSLERLHNSRDSITPEALSDYRTDYIYRQSSSHGQHRESRSNNRGSRTKTTPITTTATTTTTILTTKSTKPINDANKTKSTQDACSFWPHCGACQKLDSSVLPATKTTFSSVKRQNSLHNPKTQNAKCQHVTPNYANSLRRNRSVKEDAAHNGYANVSTVSVNVNVIKLDNDATIASPTTTTTTSHNRTQWTLLCSGASPSTTSTTAAMAATKFNSAQNVSLTANVKQLPRVLTLAATSLVFLGDCEMPITRENSEKRFKSLASKNQVYTNGRGLRRESADEVICQVREWSRRNSLQQTTTAAKYCDDEDNDDNKNDNEDDNNDIDDGDDIKDNKATTHKQQQQPAAETAMATANYLSEDERSISLPNIAQASKLKGFPRTTTTTNDGVSVIGVRNGFSAHLSHQIRAVSSPSLTDNYIPEESAIRIVGSTSTNSAQLTAAPSASVEIASKTPATTRVTTSLTTSQSVGVLQKFKRTLTNFNKNQQSTQTGNTNATSSAGSNNINNLLAPSSNATALTPTSIATEISPSDVNDSTSAKYRFGPLIWRSSKERRKTKYNRRDKCNSGDSGIQIELENDEQFARALGAGGSANAAARNANEEDSPKMRSIRRTNSAKATSISDQTTTTAAMNAKKKILKRMEMYNEREAPESLPTRSLSQPNGLETFGICRADLDDSDSDSVASHDEGPNYYPIYGEVLYSFTAAGPQELGLERGALIEILRKEVGPWWFGRIKKEDASLVEEIYDPELGWFPKEFVRVIQSPETDIFFLAHLSQLQQQPQATSTPAVPILAAAIAMPPPPPATKPLLPNAQASTTTTTTTTLAAVDRDNVTTIVIESPSYHSAASTAAAAASSNSNSNDCNSAALVPSRSLNLILDNADILRRSAVKELLDTEVNYVKLLASICEGYLPAMSKRIDIFSPNSIRLIFSNITAIYKFQRKFLEALRKGIEQNQIAKVFLKMHKGFLCYSTYCNAYPRALIELESYDRVKEAKIILDNCRESENLAELPLSAHLLAPVQRICRYPLHLGEIIKTAAKSAESAPAVAYDLQQLEQVEASQVDVADTRETIDMALDAMKSITEAVNEGKRHSETIARHQSSYQNFKGPPLHLHSTRFFLQIDATRQKQNLWNSSCTLFLFDNQLIYCKRDIIKRSQFIYKGRIFLDRCRVVNVRDGKMFGHTIKNSLRIYCEARDKWFDFSFRSANRKHRFLNTLALERQFGGKALYVSEMTGFEYAFEERDFSDQSDYELPDSESGGLSSLRMREYIYDVSGYGGGGGGNGTSATSGESSVPDSPAKSYSTLPKKQSQSRAEKDAGNNIESQTGSLGRRRLGNWFRKPKSSNCTPNHSPTHKPTSASVGNELQLPGEADSEHNLTLTAESVRDITSSSSS